MIVTYMFSFGISWGFGAWLYISEIMPLRVRGNWALVQEFKLNYHIP